MSKRIEDKDCIHPVDPNDQVTAIDEGDGWLRVQLELKRVQAHIGDKVIMLTHPHRG
jgi:hypothetical protein